MQDYSTLHGTRPAASKVQLISSHRIAALDIWRSAYSCIRPRAILPHEVQVRP